MDSECPYNLADPPPHIQRMEGIGEQRAQDQILYHRYLYYVRCNPDITDEVYTQIEWFLAERFPSNAIINGVGSSNEEDYPSYIRICEKPSLR